MKNDIALDSEEFRERTKKLVRTSGREYSGKGQVRRRCSFKEIRKTVEKLKGEPWAELVRCRGDWVRGLCYREPQSIVV